MLPHNLKNEPWVPILFCWTDKENKLKQLRKYVKETSFNEFSFLLASFRRIATFPVMKTKPTILILSIAFVLLVSFFLSFLFTPVPANLP